MRRTHRRNPIAYGVALLLAALVPRSAQAQGSVSGLVTDQVDAPVRDAEVVIARIGAFTRTDSIGRFFFRSLPSGLYRIAVRRLGYASESVEVRLADRDSIAVQVRLTQRAQPLPEVPVEADRSSTLRNRLADFERRRSSGAGQFLTANDLAPERSKPLGDVLVRLRGAYVVRSATTACLTSTRGAQSIQNMATGWCGNRPVGDAYCPVAVFLDGRPAYSGHSEDIFNLNSLHADDVAGVEYYSGSATTPREFGAPRGTCGVLVIWLKR